ncbi:MAG TPA: nickel pincer cofactor biosynthesis protein LarC [Streptosporangiaceae bacterium]|nr:nickel pincer cofactor biosynthesis protein LarC [Streptosporangiaceae bacterium]
MIVWLNPFAGISGDMLLGALLDLGAPLTEVRAAIASTGITGWELTAEPVRRSGVRACQARVVTTDRVPRRRAAELIAMVGAARPAPVAALATAAVTALAEVEARIHGVAVPDVHLHELGGIDTVADTVGVAAALHALGITQIWSAPVALGTGVIVTAHGQLPAPAPATVALLAGAQVTGAGAIGETVTPTGAALLRATGCRYGAPPPMRLVAAGYGAGTRDVPGRPNVLPAMLGAPAPGREPGDGLPFSPDDDRTQTLSMVETTVDDVTGEVLGTLPGLLLAGGALDAWLTPVTGKKGRPAQVITAMCDPAAADAVESLLLRATGSLGARRYAVQRRALPRTTTEVVVAGHRIRVKVGPHGAKPEHEDVAAAALAVGLPIGAVASQAIIALAELAVDAEDAEDADRPDA